MSEAFLVDVSVFISICGGSVVLGFCLLLLPFWESVIVLCFVERYFIAILVCNYLDGEERAGCFA